MTTTMLCRSFLKDSVINALGNIPGNCIQVRYLKWPSWRMLKDHNKRMCVKELGDERARINAIRACDFLPRELLEAAHKDVAAQPVNSNHRRTVRRCALTSKPRSTVMEWRLGRIVFRHLADYNKLAGVQRAQW